MGIQFYDKWQCTEIEIIAQHAITYNRTTHLNITDVASWGCTHVTKGTFLWGYFDGLD